MSTIEVSDAYYSRYVPPDGFEEFADRNAEGRYPLKLILYIGKTALLDITERDFDGNPTALVASIEKPKDIAMDLLRHPQAYMSPEEAREIFEISHAA